MVYIGMAIERTLSIIKPDATRRGPSGKINARFEDSGLRIIAQRRLRLNREQAEGFYSVHKERSFFSDLCEFMCSGAIMKSRIKNIFFGAYNESEGGVSSLYNICNDVRLNHQCGVQGGILNDECSYLLKSFFDIL